MDTDIVYADTNVYINWLNWEKGHGYMRHEGEEALAFFNEIKDKKHVLITSDHLEYQLKSKLGNYQDYTDYVKGLDDKGAHKHMITEETDKIMANNEALKNKTEYEDALHFVLAMKGGAKWLITNNLPDFNGFQDRILIRPSRLFGVKW